MTRNKKIIGVVIAVIILSSFMFGGDEKPIKVLSVKPEIRNVEKTVSNTELEPLMHVGDRKCHQLLQAKYLFCM